MQYYDLYLRVIDEETAIVHKKAYVTFFVNLGELCKRVIAITNI